MTSVRWILAFLAALGALLAVTLVVLQRWRGPECSSHVIIAKGPDGRPIECACVDGALATCFDPGP